MLEGKILVTVGDSITYGADMDEAGFAPDGSRMTYGWQIAKRNNMKFYNCGISGSTIQHVAGRANCFSTEGGRYTQLPDEIDYLTIFFGWNDHAFGKLGTIDDKENTSYYGGFNVVLPYLIEKYPDARICLIVHYPTDVVFGAIFGAAYAFIASWVVDTLWRLYDKKQEEKKQKQA